MADNSFTSQARIRNGKVESVSIRGSRAGDNSFDSGDEIQRKRELQTFLSEKGWAGLGGAARRPPKPELDKQFAEWRTKRTVNAGQKKAVASLEE